MNVQACRLEVDTIKKEWRYYHNGYMSLIIVEGQGGLTITIERQRTTTRILRITPIKPELNLYEKVELAIETLELLRFAVVLPENVSSRTFKHLLEGARREIERIT